MSGRKAKMRGELRAPRGFAIRIEQGAIIRLRKGSVFWKFRNDLRKQHEQEMRGKLIMKLPKSVYFRGSKK